MGSKETIAKNQMIHDIGLLQEVIAVSLSSDNYKNNLNYLLSLFQQHLNSDLIEFWVPNVEESSISLIHQIHDTAQKKISEYIEVSQKLSFPANEYVQTPVWQNSQIQWLQLSEYKNLMVRQDMAIKTGFQTVIALPIVIHENLNWIIYIYFLQKTAENKDVKELLTVCAKHLSLYFEQHRLMQLTDKFLSKSNDLICMTNFKGKILVSSNSFPETLQLKKSQIENCNFFDLPIENTTQVNEAFIANFMQNPKQTVDLVYSVNHKKLHITWSVTIVENEHSIIFSGKDITEKMEYAQSLQHSNYLLTQAYSEISTILDNANEIIYKIDPKGTIIEVSNSVLLDLGYAHEEIIGKSFLFFTHVDEVEEIYQLVITNIDNPNVVKHLKHRIKTKAGKWLWLSTSGQTIFDNNGHPLYIICISKDISESHQISKTNFEIKEKYKNFFTINPDPVLICDLKENKILEVNDAAQQLYGYNTEEFLQLSPKQLKKSDLAEQKNWKEKNSPTAYKIQVHRRKNGELFFAKVTSWQIYTGDRLVDICTIRNFTAEMEAIKLQERNHNFQDFFLENTKDSYYAYVATEPVLIHLHKDFLMQKIAANFYLNSCNDIFANRYGYASPEELQGKSIEEISALQQLNHKDLLLKFIESDFYLKDVEMETVNAFKEKNYFISTIRGQVENDQLIAIWGTSKNITDSKNAQTELFNSKLRLETITENTTDSISRYELKKPLSIVKDKQLLKEEIMENAYLAESNSTLSKRLGLANKEELYGKSIFELLKLQKIDFNLLFNTYIDNGFRLTDFECALTDQAGNVNYVSITANSLIENNKLIRMWTIAKNITTQILDQKKTEFLAGIIDQVPDVIYTIDKNFTILTWNSGAEAVFGIKKEQAIGKSITDFVSYDTQTTTRESVFKTIEQKGKWMDEIRFYHPENNKWINLLTTASKFNSNDQSDEVYIITGKDITEKKLTEAKVEEIENRFKKIANFAPVMLWQTGKNKEKFFYNIKITEFTGLSQDQLLKTPWESLIFSEDQKRIVSYINNQLENHQPFEVEYRLKSQSGIYKWILDKAVPRFLSDGSFDGYIGICVDIHETKKAFEIIKESEERFRNMADHAPVMIWLTDENDKSFYYNEGWLRFTGKTLEEELLIPWVNKIYEPDREKTDQIYQAAYAKKSEFIAEYRLISKNNEIKWILDRGTPRFLDNGDFAGYIGVCIDIQYLKQTEIDLKFANERYEIINEATNEALFESDLKMGIHYLGPGFKKLFGYSFEKANNAKWLTLIHPDDLEKVKNTFIHFDIAKLQKNNIIKCEYRFLKADNTYAFIKDVAYVIFDENGVPVKLIGSKKDISEQKEMEAKLLKNEIDKQIAINKAVIEGQEKEKLELSQELHDNINQLISSAKLYMEVAKRSNSENEMIDKSIETLSMAVQEMRRLSKSLNPTTIYKLDIIDAIEQLAVDLEQTGKLNIDFQYEEFDLHITLPQLNLYLYRIVQEQTNNILKYAKTNKVLINLKNNKEFLFLTIKDEGVGFDKTQKRNGIGISNIINRVNLFDGSINIETAPNKGCTIEIKIPLNTTNF